MSDRVIVEYESAAKLKVEKLYYTLDTGVWPERKWDEAAAEISTPMISGKLPAGTTAFYFSVIDARSLMTTSDFFLINRGE